MSRLKRELEKIEERIHRIDQEKIDLAKQRRAIIRYLKEEKFRKLPRDLKMLGLHLAEKDITKKDLEEMNDNLWNHPTDYLYLDNVSISELVDDELYEKNIESGVVFLHYPNLNIIALENNDENQQAIHAHRENPHMICVYEA